MTEWTDFTWDGVTLAEQTAHGPALPGAYTLTWDHDGLHPIAQTEQLTTESQSEVDRRFFAIITDLVGTPTHLLNPDGTTAWQARSTLWGSTTSPRGRTTYTPLRFPGQYYDPETRLHYNLHRYYDPATARYLTADPLGLDPAPNPHSYVLNPHAVTDSLGLAPCWRSDFDGLSDGKQKGAVKVVSTVGELRSIFDGWVDSATRMKPRGPKILDVYELADGTIIQWRTASAFGGETIDIFQSGSKPLKVHIH